MGSKKTLSRYYIDDNGNICIMTYKGEEIAWGVSEYGFIHDFQSFKDRIYIPNDMVFMINNQAK